MQLYDLVLFLHLATVAGAFFMMGVMMHALLRVRWARDVATAGSRR